jgi:hypothetical protein
MRRASPRLPKSAGTKGGGGETFSTGPRRAPGGEAMRLENKMPAPVLEET